MVGLESSNELDAAVERIGLILVTFWSNEVSSKDRKSLPRTGVEERLDPMSAGTS